MIAYIRKSLKSNYFILLAFFTVLICFFYLGKSYNKTEIFRFLTQTYAFYLLLGSISRKLLNYAIIFTFLVVCVIFPTEEVYGKLDFNFFTSVYYTNVSETLSYLKLVPLSTAIYLIILLFISIHLIRNNKTKIVINTKVKAILAIFLIAFPLKKVLFPKKNKINYFEDYFYVLPIKKFTCFTLYFEAKEQDNKIKAEAKKASTWEVSHNKSLKANRNVVLIVGESARREFLNCYGFPIKNTPFITKSKRIQFNNYISVASHTPTSLVRTLALCTEDLVDYNISNSVVSLSNKIGLKTYWISNQGFLGKYDAPVSLIASKADSCYFYKKGGVHIENTSDEIMLPTFDKLLENKKDESKLIVLHMMGSHPSACDRTKNKYDEYLLTDDISCYNRSIKNLDTFIEYIHTALNKQNTDFDLIYLSDHGVALKQNNGTMIHANVENGGYKVPLLYWSNKIEETKEFNAVRTGKDFLHFYSQIMDIKTTNINKTYTFMSEQPNQDASILVFNHTDYIKYEELEHSNDIDYIIKNKDKK